jgi:hypothetical protein
MTHQLSVVSAMTAIQREKLGGGCMESQHQISILQYSITRKIEAGWPREVQQTKDATSVECPEMTGWNEGEAFGSRWGSDLLEHDYIALFLTQTGAALGSIHYVSCTLPPGGN